MSEAPGWDAIDEALKRVYPRQKPAHYGTIVRWLWGGRDPLDGISVYRNPGPPRHWHLASFGLTELYRKETRGRATSGFGFELTLRLARTPTEKKPPSWALNFLQNLARYVFDTGRSFSVGHHLDLNGPMAQGKKTDVTAALFTLDPQLGEIDTPHGRMRFLQVVGITRDELESTQEWDTGGLLQVLAEDNPLLVTDLRRRSILRDRDKAQVIEQRTAKEGSSCAVLLNDSSRWRVREGTGGEQLELTLGAAMVTRLARLLRGRILHGREFSLVSQHGTVRFRPARRCSWKVKANGELALGVSPELAQQMQAELRPRRGKYHWPDLPGFGLRVVPTRIKDDAGRVVEVIG